MVSIYNYWKEGNIEKANESQKKIRAFRNVMQMGNPNSVVKLAVNMRGYHVGPARQPSNCTDPASERTPAYRGGSFLLQREQRY